MIYDFRFAATYFLNPKVTILGYSIRGDLQAMAKTLPDAFHDLESRSDSVLDIEILEKLATGTTHMLFRR